MSLFNRIKNISHDERGFTLFEMLIGLLLFSLIASIGGMAFVQGMQLHRRGTGTQRIQENALFVLETMAREIRYSVLQGVTDHGCDDPLTSLTINHPVNGAVSYWLVDGVVQRSTGGASAPLSGSDVSFEKFGFCIMGSGLDNKQTRVAIIAKVRDLAQGGSNPAFDLETTVTLRSILDEAQN